MGFDCDLFPARRHSYCADVGGGLIEHEIVHVFFGHFNGVVRPNAAEAASHRWLDPAALLAEVESGPGFFSAWICDYLLHFGDEIISWAPKT